MDKCDCTFAVRPHLPGERGCILCQCENCVENGKKPMWRLMSGEYLPCVGPVEPTAHRAQFMVRETFH